VGIVSLIAAWKYLNETRAPQASRLDLPGVAIVTVALFCLVFPLVQGRELGWPPWSFILIALSPVILAIFALFERRMEARGGFPLVRPSLFRNRAFTVGLLSFIVFFSAIPSFFLIFVLTLQLGLGFSALHAGLTTLPFALASAVASAMSVRLAAQLGKRVLYVGCTLVAIGSAGVALTVHWRGTDLTSLDLVPALLVAGAGLGCFVAPALNIILLGIHPRDAGAASGVLTTAQQVGAAVGVAVIGVIFFGLISSRAPDAAAASIPQLRADLVAAQPGAPPQQIDAQVKTFQDCYVRRAQSADPSEVPSGCPSISSNSSSPTNQAFATAAHEALSTNFTSAFAPSLIYQVVLFATTGVLCLLLPGARREPAPQRAAAPAPA
jgi:hypothetical protein